MLSACTARLLTLLAGTRLQVLLPSEFSESNCVDWGANVRIAASSHSVAGDIAPILDRLENEPAFAVQDLRWSAATSGIIAFTSAVEYFLQDLVSLCLRRNSGLRKKAFATFQIPALDLENFQTVDQIKLRHIDIIANANTKGDLLSNKFKKTAHFLDITTVKLDSDIKESLDSIWKLRNRFAHANHRSIERLAVTRSGRDSLLLRTSNKEEYTQFALDLCEIFGLAVHFLDTFDQASLTNWQADVFIQDS
jgi:hypothetical protein